MEALLQYARDWAQARKSQGGFLFVWIHLNHGKFCHVRRDSFEEVSELAFHPMWAIVNLASGQIQTSEDVISTLPSNFDDIPVQ